jgi:cation-transporting ATPase E
MLIGWLLTFYQEPAVMNDVPPTSQAGGLTLAEVAERTAQGRINRVRRSDRAEYADIVLRNVLTLFNALVVPAAIALFALRDYWAGLAVSGMVTANTLLGLIQEIRAKRHLDRLTLLAEARVRVVREGNVSEIPSGDVVQGDRVLLSAGDPVVADGEVLEARFLEVDEALLTGESDPVPRKPGDQVLSGSFCVTGEGAYRADRVGADAFAQKTATEARMYRYTASPLQHSINRLIEVLTALAVLMSLCYVGLYFLRENITPDQLVRMVAATITSMVPQGLVLMATLAFILGAVRMTARGAIVNRLNAVEAMASVDTLCMDKTGTLTTNQLKLAQLRLLTAEHSEEKVKLLLRLFASCSLDRASRSLTAIRAGLGEAEGELIDQLPFKSQNRYSAVCVRAGGAEHVLALGACEALAPRIAPGSGEWERTWKELLPTGLRLLLFARAEGGRERFDGSLDGFILHPLTLVALSDELRPHAADVLRHLAAQDITFKILSGDNPDTVRATIVPLGQGAELPALAALAEDPVISGAELESGPDPDELIHTHTVFGRVSPWQKVQIVRTLRQLGRHVAMVGDGVNDVLPIKDAHLGVAMGEGSRASKIVAGIVLQTNDFGLLPQTLDEGRTIVRNLRRAGKLFLVKNVYAFLLVVGALGVFDLPFPFVPQQVTLLNWLTIGLPALLIMLGRERSATASRSDYLREVGSFVIRTGIVTALAGLGATLISDRVLEDEPAMQRAMLLSVLVLLGAVTLWRALLDGERGILPGDRLLRWLPAVTIPVYLLAMYVPFASRLLELPALDASRWGWVLGLVAVVWGMMWASDRWTRAR